MRHRLRRRLWLAAGLVVLFSLGVARAWHAPGHDKANRLACANLPEELPAFFRAGVDTIAHCSADPDLFRLRELPELRDGEAPEHYFDLELLKGRPFPPTRSGLVEFCATNGLKPSQVGTLPYAIAEWTERLTLAFAEHRKWPENKHVRSKCLVYAGILSHYAQDACQPLHTTIHYDGRARPDGTSPASGIHNKVDALIQKVRTEPKAAKDLKPAAFERLFPAVEAEIKRTHALVDRLYKMEVQVPPEDEPLAPGSEIARFAEERLGASAEFTASLFLTAWKNSGKLELPAWDERKGP